MDHDALVEEMLGILRRGGSIEDVFLFIIVLMKEEDAVAGRRRVAAEDVNLLLAKFYTCLESEQVSGTASPAATDPYGRDT